MALANGSRAYGYAIGSSSGDEKAVAKIECFIAPRGDLDTGLICGFSFFAANDSVTNDFDQNAESYSSRISQSLSAFGQEHDFYVRAKAEVLQTAFSQLADNTHIKVLDVGCGVGLIHRYLAPVVGELHGVDISKASLDVARSNNPAVRYSQYEGKALPYATGSFDCAYAICVLHHVPQAQWQAFAREVARVVRPGGTVLVAEHNPLNPATQWVVRTCDLDESAVLLPSWRLKRLLAGAGLEGVEVHHILFTPFDRPLFRRLDRALSWLPLGAQYVASGRVPQRAPDQCARAGA